MGLLNVQYRSKHRSLSHWSPCELPEYSCFQTFAVFRMLYALFWVIPPGVWILYADVSEHSLFHLHIYPPMEMEQSVPKLRHIKFKRPGNYPEENTQLPEYCALQETCIIQTSVVCVRVARGLLPALWNPCRVAYLIPDELSLSACRLISYSTHLSDYLRL